ncbi:MULTISPECIES: ABC transporter ATP-binding protein [unclassified Haladaptatus]|uniref:ABC transporter ATP-binding protein n=1 Tax=unclassified Haladaptatus TaxID=2622732 RepID=UPI0023E76D9E|nr:MULTISPECIES: ABC transporter ATP-binding protein [unclassified Haladaptatus]
MSLISLDNVDAGYGENQVLHGVTLDVEPDRVNCIIGPNGSGKSTLLKTICGLVDVWSGSLSIQGTDVTGAHPRTVIEQGAVLLPQGGNVFPDMTVEENLRMGGFLTDDSDVLAQRFEDVYEMFPVLEERKSQRAGQMSGGQQMMVAFGRSLMADPDILLLDEPSAGLAPDLVANVFEEIERLKDRGRNMVIIEQNVRKVLDIAEYVYVLDQGTCVFEGATEELRGEDEIMDMYIGERHG